MFYKEHYLREASHINQGNVGADLQFNIVLSTPDRI